VHRKPTGAKGFYLVYGGLVALAAALALTPGAPLGLLTNAVQALAGVLLPSATVFPLLLCNDEAVLGPWVNGRGLNVSTGVVIAILVMLSIILTASVFRLDLGEAMIRGILESGTVFAVTVGAALLLIWRDGRKIYTDNLMVWRMLPLDQLPQARLTPLVRLWLIVPRFYLGFAGIWYSCASSNLPYAAADELKRTGQLCCADRVPTVMFAAHRAS
jgi:multisubunit Na+/H+ antiporter MnhF subunit